MLNVLSVFKKTLHGIETSVKIIGKKTVIGTFLFCFGARLDFDLRTQEGKFHLGFT